jgi:thioredoxin-dependent peroxiredoxin
LLGRPAPDFTLPDQAGVPVTLSAFIGRNPVVLIFYVLDNTPG